MSTAELFQIRHKLLSTSFPEFKNELEKHTLSSETFEHLGVEVYESQKFRKNWIQYILLFSQ